MNEIGLVKGRNNKGPERITQLAELALFFCQIGKTEGGDS